MSWAIAAPPSPFHVFLPNINALTICDTCSQSGFSMKDPLEMCHTVPTDVERYPWIFLHGACRALRVKSAWVKIITHLAINNVNPSPVLHWRSRRRKIILIYPIYGINPNINHFVLPKKLSLRCLICKHYKRHCKDTVRCFLLILVQKRHLQRT